MLTRRGRMQDRIVDRPDLQLDAARVGEFLGQRDLVPGKARLAHVDGRDQRFRALPAVQQAAGRLEGERVLAGFAEHQVGDAAHAVAAGARGRAVAVVDAHIGVGARRCAAGRAPSSGRRARRPAARRRAPPRRRSAPARRACPPPRSRCRDRSSSRMRGRRARSLDVLSARGYMAKERRRASRGAHGGRRIRAGKGLAAVLWIAPPQRRGGGGRLGEFDVRCAPCRVGPDRRRSVGRAGAWLRAAGPAAARPPVPCAEAGRSVRRGGDAGVEDDRVQQGLGELGFGLRHAGRSRSRRSTTRSTSRG